MLKCFILVEKYLDFIVTCGVLSEQPKIKQARQKDSQQRRHFDPGWPPICKPELPSLKRVEEKASCAAGLSSHYCLVNHCFVPNSLLIITVQEIFIKRFFFLWIFDIFHLKSLKLQRLMFIINFFFFFLFKEVSTNI